MLQKKFEYEGDIYIRPIGRGIALKSGELKDFYLEEAIAKALTGDMHGSGDFTVKIVLEISQHTPAQGADKHALTDN